MYNFLMSLLLLSMSCLFCPINSSKIVLMFLISQKGKKMAYTHWVYEYKII